MCQSDAGRVAWSDGFGRCNAPLHGEDAMNVLKLSQAIGARVLVSMPIASGSIAVYAIVRDVRKVWNRVDLMIEPEAGTGQGWVSLERVERTNDGVCTFPVRTMIGGAESRLG